MVEQVFKLSRARMRRPWKRFYSMRTFIMCIRYSIKAKVLPEHYSILNVYMTVVRGRLSLGLDDQEVREYDGGTLLKVPFKTKMNVKNLHEETLELIIVKAPAPKKLNASENKEQSSKTALFKILPWRRPSLPRTRVRSTQGAGELNYCVRYGNRCGLSAIATRKRYGICNWSSSKIV